MDFDNVVKKRVSVRKFSSKKPEPEKITELIQTANLAPAAGNLYCLLYVMVEDPDTIAKIAEACQQPWIKTAPYVIVIGSEPKLVKKMYDKRADTYVKHHVGAAVENFLLKAVDMGLASCWVGAFSEPTLRSAVNIPDGIGLEVVLPVGYEEIKGKAKQKQKYSLENRLFYGTFGNKFYKPISKIRTTDV